VSIVILVFRKNIYANGWYPEITTIMYSFTLLLSGMEIAVLVTRCLYLSNIHDSLDYVYHSCCGRMCVSYVVGAIESSIYFNMYWYHTLEWLNVVYPSFGLSKDVMRFNHKTMRTIFFCGNAVIILTLKIVDIFINGSTATRKFGIAIQVYYCFVASSALILTIIYITNWRKLLALLHTSTLSDSEKAHRTAKLTRLILIFTLCLEFSIAHSVMQTVLTSMYASIPPEYDMWSNVLDVTPKFVATAAITYYFSPLQIYKKQISPESTSCLSVRGHTTEQNVVIDNLQIQ